MRHCVKLLLLGASLLLVAACAGCSSDKLTKVDDVIDSQNVQTGIQLACATFTGLKAGWEIYKADHLDKLSDTTIKIGEGAEAAVGSLCLPPYPTNTAEVIAKVTQAGVAVLAALKHAQDDVTAAEAPPG